LSEALSNIQCCTQLFLVLIAPYGFYVDRLELCEATVNI
jgi:hypothetical protein